MLLEIDNFEQFKVFFEVIHEITDLIELQLFKDRMVCSILDKSHTRFMNCIFKKEFFALYEIDDVESVTLFAEDIYKIIKATGKIDNVVLRTDETYLICKLGSRNGNSRIFEFVLLSDYIETPQPPSITLPVSYELQLSDLKSSLNDLKMIGTDEVEFHVSRDLVGVTAGTEVTTNYVYNIITDVDTDEDYTSRYTLKHIEQLLKFEKINKIGRFSMDNNYPLVYSFEDDIMGVEVNGMIAPRLEVE